MARKHDRLALEEEDFDQQITDYFREQKEEKKKEDDARVNIPSRDSVLRDTLQRRR